MNKRVEVVDTPTRVSALITICNSIGEEIEE